MKNSFVKMLHAHTLTHTLWLHHTFNSLCVYSVIQEGFHMLIHLILLIVTLLLLHNRQPCHTCWMLAYSRLYAMRSRVSLPCLYYYITTHQTHTATDRAERPFSQAVCVSGCTQCSLSLKVYLYLCGPWRQTGVSES